MKRSECTVESLKALGYEARKSFASAWRFGKQDSLLEGQRAAEVFDAIVNIVRHGGSVDISRNNFEYRVNVIANELRHSFRGTECLYYLSRPMTEAEKLEADLYTGRNK